MRVKVTKSKSSGGPPKRRPRASLDAFLPEELRNARLPILSDEEVARLSPEGQLAIEAEKQRRVQQSINQLERRHLQQEALHSEFLSGAQHMRKVLEPDASIGNKVREGGKKGLARSPSAQDAKSIRHAKYVQAVRSLLSEHPDLSKTSIFGKVAKRFKVDSRTIRRAYSASQKT